MSETAITPRTLSDLLLEQRIPVAEALPLAVSLVHALRALHADGKVHGALSPAAVAIDHDRVVLLPPDPAAGITPYSAPETLDGQPAGEASDIFSFGAILYELLTGHAPFEGRDAEELRGALLMANPAPIGDEIMDRLLAGCLARNPGERYPRTRKLALELRLVSVAARCRELTVSRPWVATGEQLRAEVAASLHAQQANAEKLEAAATAALEAMAQQLLTAREETERAQKRVEALEHQVVELEKAAADSGGVGACAAQEIASVKQYAAGLHETALTELRDINNKLLAQATALDSVKAEIRQTDDQIEWMVEILDTLQSKMLEA